MAILKRMLTPTITSSKREVKKDAKVEDITEEGGPKMNSNMALMQTEERNTGAVKWAVYRHRSFFIVDAHSRKPRCVLVLRTLQICWA